MELKRYWRIIWRRMWIILTLTLVVGIASTFSVMSRPQSSASYVASLRIALSLPPDPRAGDNPIFDSRVQAFIATEYLVDDFTEVIKSRAFAEDVKAELGDPNADIAAIQAIEKTEKTHRILNIEITSGDKEQALRIAEATVKVIETKANKYFSQLGTDQATVRVIDPPSLSSSTNLSRNYQMDIGLRTALGFMAGLALVFLLHYLDSTLYDAEDVRQTLGLPILGEIPRLRRGKFGLLGKVSP